MQACSSPQAAEALQPSESVDLTCLKTTDVDKSLEFGEMFWMSWQRHWVHPGPLSGTLSRSRSTAGWPQGSGCWQQLWLGVFHNPPGVFAPPLSGISVSGHSSARLGVPKAGWCLLGCHVGSSQCFKHSVSAVNRRKGTALLTSHGSCGDVRGVWQPWGCHTWHLSLFLLCLYIPATAMCSPGDTEGFAR